MSDYDNTKGSGVLLIPMLVLPFVSAIYSDKALKSDAGESDFNNIITLSYASGVCMLVCCLFFFLKIFESRRRHTNERLMAVSIIGLALLINAVVLVSLPKSIKEKANANPADRNSLMKPLVHANIASIVTMLGFFATSVYAYYLDKKTIFSVHPDPDSHSHNHNFITPDEYVARTHKKHSRRRKHKHSNRN